MGLHGETTKMINIMLEIYYLDIHKRKHKIIYLFVVLARFINVKKRKHYYAM